MSCVSKIARSIAMNCQSPLVGGYTGRGVAIDFADVLSIEQDAQNPRKVLNIALADGAKVCAIDNAMLTTPFEGSNTTGNGDAGYIQFTKLVSGRILTRGAQNSADLVEPLAKNPNGFLLLLEKRDKVGDGSIEVVGLIDPARVADPATIVRNENENGGAITFSMQSVEHWFECTFVPKPEDGESQWHASHLAFEKLLDNALPEA